MTRQRKRTPLVAATFLLAALAGGQAAAEVELDDVLARFDAVQNSIHTLSAEFHETTTNPLLLEPVTAEGRFYMTKPDSIRWEYAVPEEMRFVIAENTYTGYFPDQKRAERRSIKRWSQHIFRFFGVGQGSDELSKFYTIRLGQAENDIPDTYLLLLEPKRKRARKRVEEVRFWLDDSSFLPVRVEYSSQTGNSRLIEFRGIQVNPDLSASLYTMEIPADVDVSTGFSGLPDFDPDSTP